VAKTHPAYVEGDLFASLDPHDPKLVIIPHVVNDEKVWGAGFVLPLAEQFPVAKTLYLANHDLALGQTQFVPSDDGNVVVANMVAQHFGHNPPLIYDSLEACLKAVATTAKQYIQAGRDVEIRCPLFGSGIAGGDWNKIEELIARHWLENDLPVTVFYLRRFLPPGWTPPN